MAYSDLAGAGCCAHCPSISLEALRRSPSTSRSVLANEASPYPLPPLLPPPPPPPPSPLADPLPPQQATPLASGPSSSAAASAAASGGRFYPLLRSEASSSLHCLHQAASMWPTTVSPPHPARQRRRRRLRPSRAQNIDWPDEYS